MTKQERMILTEEQMALDKYADERRKVSDGLYAGMQKFSFRDNLIEGLFGGLLIGAVFIVAGNTLKKSQLPLQDKNPFVIEQKDSAQQMPHPTLTILTIATLAGLLFAYVKSNVVSSEQNYERAHKMACNVLKSYFEKSLQNYEQKDISFRAMRAAALVINNMPEEKLEYLRALASSGLTYDIHGQFSINPDNINAAEKIISNYINRRPQIKENIIQIMNGENLKTYVLTGIKQRTK